nr:transposon TX1 putative 149 kDa protein [Tanacetum cinerariifolium]
MASMNTRLNIEKLDGNIIQKHGGSKQVGFKQLGPGVETRVHGVSNDDTAVTQKWLEDKQPEEKTNTDCLVKEQEKEYQTRWKIKTGNVLDSCNQRSTQQYKKSRVAKHLSVAVIQQHNGLVKETNVTLLAKVVLYRNMGFNESEEYKKTFIGSGVGTGSMQVLYGFAFEVEPLGDHTFEVEPQENVDQGAGLQEVQTQDLIYYHLARDREQHLACKLFGYKEDINEAAYTVVIVEKIYAHESPTFNNTVACEVISKWKAGMKDDMDAWLDVYVLSNNDMVFSCGCKAEIWATKGLLDKAKENVLGMKIVRDRSRKILRVSQSGGGVYGPYGGCEGSYLAKGTLGRVRAGARLLGARLMVVVFFSTTTYLHGLLRDNTSPPALDEIHTAVWGCGVDKSSGPDGFTFEFFRKYWAVVGPDFSTAVEWFFEHGDFAIGCNSSFVTLIPKFLDLKVVSDYRPISLIGSFYKVVTKILATQLSLVILDLISDVQTAFLPNR